MSIGFSTFRDWTILLLLAAVHGLASLSAAAGDEKIRSYPPLRTVPPPANRPLTAGPARFVDAHRGDDANLGTLASPWKTIQHGVEQLVPGDTLYLRGGTYYENVTVRTSGAKDRPLTIASHPGEQAVLDGGLRNFFEHPDSAWEPVPSNVAGEYRSTKRHPNARLVVGSFGDSMVGLQSYYHAEDLRATLEAAEPKADQSDVQPMYCGPGLWYDAATGFIHCRLQHTHLPLGDKPVNLPAAELPVADNYRGETDPRKLPLVIAPFRSVPLALDGAQFLRVQDLVIRGAGYETVTLDQTSDVEFDNVTIWCGTYGIRAIGAQRFKFHRSALHGSLAPWNTRFETSLNTYPGRTQRDITRLNTHALLVANANPEYSVYHNPFNDDWEISYSDFTEGSDGLYLGGIGLRFHHNLVDNMQDDGIYLSPMYDRHKVFGGPGTIHLHQNHFSRALTMVAYGGLIPNHDTVYFYRNVVDLRGPVLTGRHTLKEPRVGFSQGKATGDHGSPPWSALNAYHNTFISRSPFGSAEMRMATGATESAPHRIFNNIFVHLDRAPELQLATSMHLQVDANLYWKPGLESGRSAAFFQAYRASPAYQQSLKAYAPGYDANSVVGDPLFVNLSSTPADYRLQPGSAAIDAGIPLPEAWPDPLRAQDRHKPDLGALPLDAPAWTAGRAAAPRP